ncbi:MAG: aminoacyl-tRNA hydrolase [Bacteriovoracaceae bacterium]|nr:aminoacyl-tRNA hydrolase [Bacteriovoracaceae bacterium]
MNKLIVLLGNPGAEYEGTRHNVAWQVMDNSREYSILAWKSKFKGLFASMDVDNDKIYFLKPETYMNLSGESVKPLCSFFKIEPQNILVIQDELDLPVGTIVAKCGGGLAGHNGLKSISQHMGTNDYYRLRIGIGRPVHGSISDHVLSNFKGDDLIIIERVYETSEEIIKDFCQFNYERAFKKYNKKIIIT